jgi:hypothetical protein
MARVKAAAAQQASKEEQGKPTDPTPKPDEDTNEPVGEEIKAQIESLEKAMKVTDFSESESNVFGRRLVEMKGLLNNLGLVSESGAVKKGVDKAHLRRALEALCVVDDKGKVTGCDQAALLSAIKRLSAHNEADAEGTARLARTALVKCYADLGLVGIGGRCSPGCGRMDINDTISKLWTADREGRILKADNPEWALIDYGLAPSEAALKGVRSHTVIGTCLTELKLTDGSGRLKEGLTKDSVDEFLSSLWRVKDGAVSVDNSAVELNRFETLCKHATLGLLRDSKAAVEKILSDICLTGDGQVKRGTSREAMVNALMGFWHINDEGKIEQMAGLTRKEISKRLEALRTKTKKR